MRTPCTMIALQEFDSSLSVQSASTGQRVGCWKLPVDEVKLGLSSAGKAHMYIRICNYMVLSVRLGGVLSPLQPFLDHLTSTNQSYASMRGQRRPTASLPILESTGCGDPIQPQDPVDLALIEIAGEEGRRTDMRRLLTTMAPSTPRRRHFAPLGVGESVSDAPKLRGVVFDVDGTLWYVCNSVCLTVD